jgi:hypothetical protein
MATPSAYSAKTCLEHVLGLDPRVATGCELNIRKILSHTPPRRDADVIGGVKDLRLTGFQAVRG